MKLSSAVLSVILAAPFVCSSPPHHGRKFDIDRMSHLIVFGDSYSFIQGTRGYPGYSFIGDYRSEENLAYTPAELLTTRINQTFFGTSAGGPNWAEYLTGCALEDGFWYPWQCKTQLWDFAFAGSNFSPEFLPPHADYTTPMLNQTEQYLTYGDPVLRKTMRQEDVLVGIWIGINDVGDAVNVITNTTDTEVFTEFYDSIIQAMYKESVQSLYEAGYRNFVFINIPPRDRAPGREPDDLPTSAFIQAWNTALDTRNGEFSASHPEAFSVVYDSYSFFNRVLDNYEEYGFRNTTDFCPGYNNATVQTHPELWGCRPIDTYFWFNAGHIGTRAHEVMTADLRRFLRSKSYF